MLGWQISTITFSTSEHPTHPLMSASLQFLLRQSTFTPLSLISLWYPSQAQQPPDGILVAKYVGLENQYLPFFPTSEHPTHPLMSAILQLYLRQGTFTPLTMPSLSYPSHAHQPHDGILVAKYVGLEYQYHRVFHF